MTIMAKQRKKESAPNPWPARLKTLRKYLGISQREAAEKTGVVKGTWIAWENSQRVPGRMAIQLLKKAFPDHFKAD